MVSVFNILKLVENVTCVFLYIINCLDINGIIGQAFFAINNCVVIFSRAS